MIYLAETSWEKPILFQSVNEGEEEVTSFNDEWITLEDPVSGLLYYSNMLSNKTQWENPFIG